MQKRRDDFLNIFQRSSILPIAKSVMCDKELFGFKGMYYRPIYLKLSDLVKAK